MNTQGWKTQHLQAGDDGILSKCCNWATRPFFMCWVWSHKVDLEEHPSRIYLEPLIHFGGKVCYMTWIQLKAGWHWLPDRFTVLFTLSGFSRDRDTDVSFISSKWIMEGNYTEMEIPTQLFPDARPPQFRLCVCIRRSDVVDSGGGSAKQGEIEKKAKLNRRDRQPLLLLFPLHFRSHVHICFTGLWAEGRSILNLVPHPAIFTNFFWLLVCYSNGALPRLWNCSWRKLFLFCSV